MTRTNGGSLCLLDERGRLIGTIDRPREREPLGPGHETVYLARPVEESARVAAA
ncbi:MAG: hypothetical protein ACREN6_07765 [Gemmatimonadaceae bacterium]